MMKKMSENKFNYPVLLAMIVMTMLFTPASAQLNPAMTPRSSVFIAMNNASTRIHALEVRLVDLRHERRTALRNFIREHIGDDLLQKNRVNVDNLADLPDGTSGGPRLRSGLDNLLKKVINNRRERTRLINQLELPPFPTEELKHLENHLEIALTALRVPVEHGNFKYATHSRSFGGYGDRDMLTAHHEKGNWQEFNKSYRQKLYGFNIFSPTRNSLFRGNRDVYLEKMTINYQAQGHDKTIEHEYNRFLRRGERIDYELPEIAEQASINIRYACRREHRGSAVFVVQPILAEVQDNWNSPFLSAVNAIKAFSSSGRSIPALQTSLQNINRELQNATNIALQYGY